MPPAPGHCCACFTGDYPVAIPEVFSRGSFLEGYEPTNLADPSPTALMSVQEVADVLEVCREEAENAWGHEVVGASGRGEQEG